jgi:EAL domain-containing protein (putative c-di-GMP-specific phosphodiesterase class I)
LTVENDLRRALDCGELELRYQPQISLSLRKVVGMEALVRWRHPAQGLLDPARFIGVAEEAGLITRISDWVLDQACAQLAHWRAGGFDQLRMAVNLSPREFEQGDVVERVTSAIQRYRLPPQGLDIEITETLMIRDVDSVVDAVQRLRDSGVRVSIDDFGTGYSSLSALQQFPIGTLKIDQSFVRDVSSDQCDASLVGTMVALAKQLKLASVAEGVETKEQLAFLLASGCEAYQGYLFSPARPADEITRLLGKAAPPATAAQPMPAPLRAQSR